MTPTEMQTEQQLRQAYGPKLITPLPGPKARAIIEADDRLISPSYTRSYPMVAKRGRGIRVEDSAEVGDGIAAALAHDGPVLVDAVVNRTELAMPPSITFEMAKGFSLYMVKAIMNGRADEIIDLAKTNLWR